MNPIDDPDLRKELPDVSDVSEMAERIRTFDWSTTAIGPAESWSPALRAVVSILVASRFPMLLLWGPDYIQFYNDAYRPVLGKKHPDTALGQRAGDCWAEIWQVIGPLFDTPFHGGPATWMEDILLEVNRHGFVEETHFTIAYSPVPDESVAGGIGGVLATVHEITGKVIGERRIMALRDVAARGGLAKTPEHACAIAAASLAENDRDIPFVLLYLIDADRTSAHLAGAAGVAMGEEISPPTIDLRQTEESSWPLAEALSSESMVVVRHLGDRFGDVPAGPWSDRPEEAVVIPVPSNRGGRPAAVLVAGASSRLKLDEMYSDFFALVSSQVATAIANARAYDEERKRAEALAELDRAKTTFFSNVSHEFRTPLTLMLGPSEELLAMDDNQLPPRARDLLDTIHRNALRLQKLVNTLLDFSRIEEGRARASFEPVDLAALTGDLASVFRSAIEKAGMRLVVDCPPLAGPVPVDRDLWEKIVLNLLSNAFKYTPSGEIEVSLRDAGDDVQLSVRDTGVGIDASQITRIFERFHRVEGTGTRTQEGSGIGLALVQELVRLHGGTVVVESTPGVGSTFTVTIPRIATERAGGIDDLDSTALSVHHYVDEAMRWIPLQGERSVSQNDATEQLDDARHAQQSSDSPQAVCRILVIDDNADMRDYVRRLLSERYSVETVADGESGLASARRVPPDLIMTDVMLPRMDGMQLLHALRADPRTRDVPVILLSARAGEESRIEGMRAGADDYLVKPFSARELLARIEVHLDMAGGRRRIRETLSHQNLTRFESLINAAPVGIYLVDSHLRLRQVNPIALPAFVSIPEVIGSDFVEVMNTLWPSDHATEIIARFRHTLATGEPYLAPPLIAERADLKVVEYYEWQLRRISLLDEEYGVVCYYRDISQEVLARQALDEADRRKNEFLAMLAHELRNPLAPILNGAQVLQLMGDDKDVVQSTADMIQRQIAQMGRLVDDLLDVSRVSQGKIALRLVPTELAAAVNHAIEATRSHMEMLGHELTVTLPDELIYLNGDSTRLAQIVGNLLNNASKFTPRGGRIALLLEREGDQAVLKVRDNGIGIEADRLPDIFTLFTQLDTSLGRTQSGLGIGLTLVQNLVEMHGGSVTVRSEGLGRGSEFTVRLPVLPETPALLPDAMRRPLRLQKSRRILVVDDNRDSATSLTLLLRLNGNEIHTAYDGLEAVKAAEEFRPEIILLDIGLPKLDGFGAARRIREEPWGGDIILVALTGWGQHDDRQKSSDAGFDAHIVKPVDHTALVKLLEDLQSAKEAG